VTCCSFCPGFRLVVVRDMALKHFRRPAGGEDTFETICDGSLGPTICEVLTSPMRGTSGHRAKDLAETAARRRVSAASIGKILKKVAGQIPAEIPTRAVLLPRQGYGQMPVATPKRPVARAEFLFQLAYRHSNGWNPRGPESDQRWPGKLIPRSVCHFARQLSARSCGGAAGDVVEAARGYLRG